MKKTFQNNIRIKDIASKAKVSIGTVDRVLHNRGEVSESTKKLILKIIDELGYTPNILAKSLASKKKYTIAVVIPDYNDNNLYWEKPLAGIKAASKELNAYNFKIAVFPFNIGDESSFIKQLEKAISEEISGIIFSPLFLETSLKFINNCELLKIPYVFIDVHINNCGNLSYFGQNSVQSGYLAAQLLHFGLRPESNIYILKLISKTASSYHLNLREIGFNSYFEKISGWQQLIKTYEIDISNDRHVETSFHQIFSKQTNPIGIFVPNSRVYKVAKYFDNNEINNTIIIGYDLLDENIYFLEKGTIQFLINQKPEEQGYKSVISFFNYLLANKKVEKFNYSPIEVVMKENVEYYKNYISNL